MAFSIGGCALIEHEPVHGAAWLLLPGIPVLAVGQLLAIDSQTDRGWPGRTLNTIALRRRR